MPKFLNTNRHAIYVDDPDDDARDLTRIYSGAEVNASGVFADNLAATPGVVLANSEAAEAYHEHMDGDDEGKFGVNSPQTLAVGPDLEPPVRSTSDQDAESYGAQLAVKQGDLQGLTKDELQDLADERGVEYLKKDTKAELIDKLSARSSAPGGTIQTSDVPKAG